MVDVDKVLILSWFGHFDPLQMEYTLVASIAPDKSGICTRPLHFCSVSSHPAPSPPFLMAPWGKRQGLLRF